MINFKPGYKPYYRVPLAIIHTPGRCYSEHSYLTEFFLDKPGNCIYSRIKFDKDKIPSVFPDYILKYYLGTATVLHPDSNKKSTRLNDPQCCCLKVSDELEKFIVTTQQAEDMLQFMSDNVPSSLKSLPKDVISLFCTLLDESAEYDLQNIFMMQTEAYLQGSGWNEYWKPTKCIVTDANLNPIDVTKFIETMKKIIVDA